MNKFLKRITAVLLLAMMLPMVAFAQDDVIYLNMVL